MLAYLLQAGGLRQFAPVLRDSNYPLNGHNLVSDARFAASQVKPRKSYLLETYVPKPFAAGDGRTDAMTRVASAVGKGSVVIKFVQHYLDE